MVFSMSFEFKKLAIKATFFFEVADSGDVPVAQNNHFIAALVDIPQQMRRDHNVHVAAANGQFGSDFCSASGADPCSNPNRVAGGSTATLTFTVPNTPGAKIPYRCDFHSSEMNGTITVK